MSRSGYSDDCDDNWALIRWRGAVASAIRGKRGQAVLKEILSALESIESKTLTSNSLKDECGEFCTLGALGAARGLDMEFIDPYCREEVAHAFGIPEALAAEIMYENDECISNWKFIQIEICGPMRPYYPDYGNHTKTIRVIDENVSRKRWLHMREWIKSNIKKENNNE